MRRQVACGLILLLIALLSACPGRPAWTRGEDLSYGTAFTLEEGRYEIGLFAPFQYGVSDSVSVGMHPILVLLVPNASMRYRFFESAGVALAANLGALWSFTGKEDREGAAAPEGGCETCGYPGTLQLTTTASWLPHRNLVLSVGGGVSAEFIDLDPHRVLGQVHASMAWLLEGKHLVLLQGSTHLGTEDSATLVRPSGQLVYAHDWDGFMLAIGVAVGEFPIRLSDGTIAQWPVYPVIDVWWRL